MLQIIHQDGEWLIASDIEYLWSTLYSSAQARHCTVHDGYIQCLELHLGRAVSSYLVRILLNLYQDQKDLTTSLQPTENPTSPWPDRALGFLVSVQSARPSDPMDLMDSTAEHVASHGWT